MRNGLLLFTGHFLWGDVTVLKLAGFLSGCCHFTPLICVSFLSLSIPPPSPSGFLLLFPPRREGQTCLKSPEQFSLLRRRRRRRKGDGRKRHGIFTNHAIGSRGRTRHSLLLCCVFFKDKKGLLNSLVKTEKGDE